MTGQDAAVSGTDTACCQYIFIIFNCKNLSTDQTRHTYPVKQSKHNKHGDHIGSEFFKHGSLNQWL